MNQDDIDTSKMVGLLAALVILDKDRFERFPEVARAWFYSILGADRGELAWHTYWRHLTIRKEREAAELAKFWQEQPQ